MIAWLWNLLFYACRHHWAVYQKTEGRRPCGAWGTDVILQCKHCGRMKEFNQ